MKKALLMAALATAVVGGACGGGRSGVKPAPPSVSTFTDSRDGKVYKIVQIGRQVWFAENLNYDVPDDTSDVCYENSPDSCAKYGRLYNWETALTVCPAAAGYYLPTDDEWTTLINYVGGEKKAGTKLKSSTGWKSYKKVPAGTDEYGFTALPGGFDEYEDGHIDFFGAGFCGGWWSATKHDADNAWARVMCFDVKEAWRGKDSKTTLLMSVRCVADK